MVAAILESAPAETSEPLIDSERQRDLLERALEALRRFRTGRATTLPLDLLAVDLAEALDSLGEITGEVTSEELLQRVFSSFCVGK
jgi:tRNA modification GTPase